MIDDISPPGSWVRELSARPHTYRDVWAALREAEARVAAVEAERDALRAALNRLLDSDHAMSMQAHDCEDGNLIIDIEDWDKHSAVVRETRKLLAAREAT